MHEHQLHVSPDLKSLAEDAAERIIAVAKESLISQDYFSIALSGGSTPKTLFALLASDRYSKRIDWKRWRIYWGDERCVPPDHPDSNYGMAAKALLDHVPIPKENIFRMKGELDPQTAAIEYGKLLKSHFGEDGGIDVNLLGMGDDGHTASLFPHTEALTETHHRCLANFVPKLKVWRITMSVPFINRSKYVMAMIAGAGKKVRLEEVLHGPAKPEETPIQMIQPISGNMLWLLDAAAAGMMGE